MNRPKGEGSRLASVALVAWAGAFLEWLDFYTYGILAKVVARVFFPSTDPIASLIASYGALAVGFLFRPLGAILFGKIGDQLGRKRAFVIAALLMLVGTVGVGLAPSYAQVGVLASILVFALRMVQGLALGGGYGAAITYLGEFAPEHRRGLITGVLFTTPAAGMGVAGSIQTFIGGWLGAEQFAAWGWRLNFIVAGALVFAVALILHLIYRETPIFDMLKRVRRVTSSPVREVFSKRYLPLVLMAWIGVVGAHGPVWYTNNYFNSQYLQIAGGLSTSEANKILSTAIYASLWTYPLFGWLSDKIGRKPVLLLGIYGNALWFPVAFKLYDKYLAVGDETGLWLTTLTMTLFNGVGYSGAMSALLLELFPARIRLSSVALSYNLGYGLTGGFTPLVVTSIYRVTGDLYQAVVLWSTLVPMIMGALYALRGPETLGTRIWAELSAGRFAKRPPLVVPPGVPLVEAAKRMIESGVRAAFVVGSGVGVLEERALVRAIARGAGLGSPVSEHAVRVECVREDEPVTKIFVVIEEKFLRHAPICDSSGELVGYVSARELVNEALALDSIAKKRASLRFRVRDVAARDLVYVRPGAPLREVARIMAENNVGFVPILSDGEIVGVLSEYDLLRAIALGADLGAPVEALARREGIITVNGDSTLREAAELMLKHNIRHLPVLDNGRVAAVVSIRDVIKAVG
ncbi:MAG: MFS transporter [Fervidicoccaceae archaeon]